MTDNFKIFVDSKQDGLRVSTSLKIPTINSNRLPKIAVTGQIGFDVVTMKTWECYSITPILWRPIGGGGTGTGSTFDYALRKSGTQSIPSGVETTITSFSIAAPYFDNTSGWNPGSGVYLADATPHSFVITVKLSWAGGITNQGLRSIRIYYQPFIGPATKIGDTTDQAAPYLEDPTSQTATAGASMSPGDTIYVRAYQDSGVNLTIDAEGGYTGHRTNP